MKRPDTFAIPRWDDPFWHAVRMLVDVTGRKRRPILQEAEIIPALEKARTDAARGLLGYLSRHEETIPVLAEYTKFRVEAAEYLLDAARSEEEAKADFAALSDMVVATYGTQSADHHQSPKLMVSTMEVLTRKACLDWGLTADVNPQTRASMISVDYIWVSPRRLDGAMPSLLNPVALWEIKEYWGKTSGGSKMSDAIYECQLVGEELRTFEDMHGRHVYHYVILDGKEQWLARVSDMRRAVDLLCAGLIDELLVGREVVTEWPRIIADLTGLMHYGSAVHHDR